MPTVGPDDVAQFLARNFSTTQYDQCESVINVVSAEVSAWTRSRGFDDGVPNVELWSVILATAARRIANPTNVVRESLGAVEVTHAPPGFTLAEQRVLNRYRETAL